MSARAPTLSESAPAMGAISSGVAVHGRKRSPVPSGESPRANWKYWLVRKAAEKIAAAIRNWVVTAEVKRFREQAERDHRLGGPASHHDEAGEQRGARRSARSGSAVCPSRLAALTRPQMRTPTPPETRTRAGTSSRARGPVALRQTQPRPTSASDADRDVDPEDPVPAQPLGDAPPISGPLATASPAMPPQIPTTAPRFSDGKAEVRRVRLRGITMAAPMP